MSDDLQHCFPGLACADDPLVEAMLQRAEQVELPAHCPIYHRGDECHHYILLLSGAAKVVLTAANGREVVLYRVESGESCVLTTVGLLGGDRYPADGVTETPVRALRIRAELFAQMMDQSAVFRQFVFGNMGQRLTEVIARMEQVKFGDIDSRLALSLLNRLNGAQPVKVTHQTLADDMGTAREVVSRHLKQFESRGWIALGRGTVTVLEAEPLQSLSKVLCD